MKKKKQKNFQKAHDFFKEGKNKKKFRNYSESEEQQSETGC